MFRDFYGTEIEDIVEYSKKYVASMPNQSLFVGCDSQVRGDVTVYATVICFYNEGKGAHVVYQKEKENRNTHLFSRLWAEVERTINLAATLRDRLPRGIMIDTHFDINPNEQYRSNIVYRAAVGYAQGAGFMFKVKPQAWAATCAADRLC